VPPPEFVGPPWITWTVRKLCLKNVPHFLCYNFDTREHILILFGNDVTHKVSNQKTLYYATLNNVCFCTIWQNWETRKSHFFTQMLYQCIASIQPVAPWFLQSFWLTTHTHAAIWLPKSSSQCVQLGLLGAEQGMGRWVMGHGSNGHENRMGHMGHGSLGVGPWPISFFTLWLGLYIVAMIIYHNIAYFDYFDYFASRKCVIISSVSS